MEYVWIYGNSILGSQVVTNVGVFGGATPQSCYLSPGSILMYISGAEKYYQIGSVDYSTAVMHNYGGWYELDGLTITLTTPWTSSWSFGEIILYGHTGWCEFPMLFSSDTEWVSHFRDNFIKQVDTLFSLILNTKVIKNISAYANLIYFPSVLEMRSPIIEFTGTLGNPVDIVYNNFEDAILQRIIYNNTSGGQNIYISHPTTGAWPSSPALVTRDITIPPTKRVIVYQTSTQNFKRVTANCP